VTIAGLDGSSLNTGTTITGLQVRPIYGVQVIPSCVNTTILESYRAKHGGREMAKHNKPSHDGRKQPTLTALAGLRAVGTGEGQAAGAMFSKALSE
jgi:hypothetical protein